MTISLDQMAGIGKSGVDILGSLAQTQLAFIEKLTTLNLLTAKTSLESSLQTGKALLDVRGLQDVFTIGTATAQPTIDKTVAYSRSVYEIVSEAQAKTSEIFKAQTDDFSKQTFDALDRFGKSGVPGSDTAAAALKSALSASQNAYDTFNKAAKQATEFVESSIASVTPKAPV